MILFFENYKPRRGREDCSIFHLETFQSLFPKKSNTKNVAAPSLRSKKQNRRETLSLLGGTVGGGVEGARFLRKSRNKKISKVNYENTVLLSLNILQLFRLRFFSKVGVFLKYAETSFPQSCRYHLKRSLVLVHIAKLSSSPLFSPRHPPFSSAAERRRKRGKKKKSKRRNPSISYHSRYDMKTHMNIWKIL